MKLLFIALLMFGFGCHKSAFQSLGTKAEQDSANHPERKHDDQGPKGPHEIPSTGEPVPSDPVNFEVGSASQVVTGINLTVDNAVFHCDQSMTLEQLQVKCQVFARGDNGLFPVEALPSNLTISWKLRIGSQGCSPSTGPKFSCSLSKASVSGDPIVDAELFDVATGKSSSQAIEPVNVETQESSSSSSAEIASGFKSETSISVGSPNSDAAPLRLATNFPAVVAVRSLPGAPFLIACSATAVRTIQVTGNVGVTVSQKSIYQGSGIVDCQLGDMDNDGDIDVVLASNSVGIMWIDIAEGSLMGIYPISGEINVYESLALGDFNGDKKLDVAVSAEGTQEILLFEQLNIPTSIFRRHVVASQVDPEEIGVGDINNDGALDLAAVLDTQNKVMVFYAVAFPGFSPKILSETLLRPEAVTVIDFDKDGFRVNGCFFKRFRAVQEIVELTFSSKNLRSGLWPRPAISCPNLCKVKPSNGLKYSCI